MKSLIKTLLRESLDINKILDKISVYGINSLTPHEKAILDSSATGKKVVSPEKQAMSWLKANFTNLEPDTYNKNTYKGKAYGFEYSDKTGEPIIYVEMVKEASQGYEPSMEVRINSIIFDKLINEFGLTNVNTDLLLKKWLNKHFLGKLSKFISIFDKFTIKPFKT